MFAENRGPDGYIQMDYPFETTIPLDKKCWAGIAHIIMSLEGLKQVDVKLEPGKWYESKEDRTSVLGPLVDFVFGPKTIYLLGSHVMYTRSTRKVTRKTYEVIHLAVGREDKEIYDTLLHEIAHALTFGDDHGKRWEAEYLRLMEDYHSFQSGTVIYELLKDLYDDRKSFYGSNAYEDA